MADRFASELLVRGRALNLDAAQSLAPARPVCLRATVLVIAGRFLNEVLVRGCTRVVLNVGSRNRAVETAGCRKRAVENVRCGAVCGTLLMPLCPGTAVVLCGAFLCGGLFGICAPAVSASAKLPIQIKRLRFIISPLLTSLIKHRPPGEVALPAAAQGWQSIRKTRAPYLDPCRRSFSPHSSSASQRQSSTRLSNVSISLSRFIRSRSSAIFR